ncbi:MAG: flagellar hook-length control protein FliK [Proteobacteria bacterium]|nr:flagellar hook-length control protein FliK [Pseudomonadota bacterium]
MIPGDLASRLRMLSEVSFFSGEPTVAPTARVRAVTSVLPDFTPGQRITASLQAAAQDNTYHARIDGREVILSLPQSVKAGDTLELIVSKVTPQAIMATLAQPTGDTATSSQAALSQTGKLISVLLTGQPAVPSASLNGGQPLLPAAPQTPAATSQLAGQLGTAVTESGLFYEAHQARWLSGQLDTATLRKEPQGSMPAILQAPISGLQSSPPSPAGGQPAEMVLPSPWEMLFNGAQDTANNQEAGTTRREDAVEPQGRRSTEDATSNQASSATRRDATVEPQGRRSTEDTTGNQASTPLSGGKTDSAAPIAEKLLPIVHQQLDTLATHQAVWQGQIWPGQIMEWEIEDPSRDARDSDDQQPEPYWNSTLRLTLPSLGGIEARLHLTPAGVAVRLIADDSTTREALQSGESRLADSLAAANVPLTGLVAELRGRQ